MSFFDFKGINTIEATTIVRKSSSIYLNHLKNDLVGIILQGSAFKGGIIRNSSDIDFQVFVNNKILDSNGFLPYQLCIEIQKELSKINLLSFRNIQTDVFSKETFPSDYSKPINGTYKIIYGRVPIPEASQEEIFNSAIGMLESIDLNPKFLTNDLLEHKKDNLERSVRLLTTKVWPSLYSFLTIQRGIFDYDQNLKDIWAKPKTEVYNLLPKDSELYESIIKFQYLLTNYYSNNALNIETAFKIIDTGLLFLRIVHNQSINLLKMDRKN